MKKITRIFGAVLVLTMLLSLAAPCALAATAETVKQYGADDGLYLAFGDSVGRGCAAEANFPDGYYYKTEYRVVPNAFPYLVAQAVGCRTGEIGMNSGWTETDSNYWPACYFGQSLSYTMELLGIEFNTAYDNDTYDHVYFGGGCNWYNTYFNKAANPAALADIQELVKDATLITVELGMCDLFNRAMVLTNYDMTGSFDGAFALSAEFAEIFIKHLYEGYDFWVNNYTKLIDYLIEHNENNATIVMVGAYNMLSGLVLETGGEDEEIYLEIGNVAAVLSGYMNQCFKSWASQYQADGKNVAFADISNVETPTSAGSYTLDEFLGNGFTEEELGMSPAQKMTQNIHPSIAGNTFIARQVLSVLPEEELGGPVEDDPVIQGPTISSITIPGTNIKVPIIVPAAPAARNTNIAIDMSGAITDVSKIKYVMVGTRVIKDFDLQDYVLNVPYSRKDALTVTVVAEIDGKLAVYTYQLSYGKDGYTAYRIYNTNDVGKTATRLFTTMNTIGNKIATAIKSLFKK